MKKHIKVYMDYFGYNISSVVYSEISGKPASDIHHIVFKSQGGKDEISNLIALTREEHQQAVYVDPIMAKEVEIKILVKRYGKKFEKTTATVYEDGNGFGVSVLKETYVDGVVTDVKSYDCEDNDECHDVLGRLGYMGEELDAGLSFYSIK